MVEKIQQKAELTVDKKEFESRLKSQISKGNDLFPLRIETKEQLYYIETEYNLWDDFNSELLKISFNNPNSDYLSRYLNAGSMIGVFGVLEGANPDRLTFKSDIIKEKIQSKLYELDSIINRIELIPSSIEYLSSQKNKKNISSKIFIGHGRSKLWARVKLFLQDDLKLEPLSFESESRTSESIINILEDFLNKSSYAILIMTAEDETADGNTRARQNVIHEAGLFQGRLGFDKVIILKQNGTEEFSNIAGLQYIPFSDDNIEQCFYELQRKLTKIGLIK